MTTFTESITVEALESDPYPIYERLRQESPVAFVPAINSWLATRWEDMNTVSSNPAIFSAEDEDAPVVRHFGSPAIIHTDGAVHRELRKGLAAHYMPAKVATYIEELARPIAKQHIERFRHAGQAELMSEFFEPVSVLCLAKTLGLGDIGADVLMDWFHGLAMGAINFGRDPERTKICDDTKTQIATALDPILTRLESEADSSPLSHLLHHSLPEGQVRSRDFILPSVYVTLLGGMQEPGHGAANTLFGLLQNPDQLTTLRNDPKSWITRAVQEGVRWIAPIGTQGRSPVEDFEMAGVVVPKGASISSVLASANRDPAVFDHADLFDMSRKPSTIASFGFGPHFCAGKWFANAQMEIMLDVLFEMLGDIRLIPDNPPEFFGWEFRAPTSFKVQFTAK